MLANRQESESCAKLCDGCEPYKVLKVGSPCNRVPKRARSNVSDPQMEVRIAPTAPIQKFSKKTDVSKDETCDQKQISSEQRCNPAHGSNSQFEAKTPPESVREACAEQHLSAAHCEQTAMMDDLPEDEEFKAEHDPSSEPHSEPHVGEEAAKETCVPRCLARSRD